MFLPFFPQFSHCSQYIKSRVYAHIQQISHILRLLLKYFLEAPDKRSNKIFSIILIFYLRFRLASGTSEKIQLGGLISAFQSVRDAVVAEAE